LGSKSVLATVINHDTDNAGSMAKGTHKMEQEACFHLHIFYSQSFYAGVNNGEYTVYFGNREGNPGQSPPLICKKAGASSSGFKPR
jgi:hypothetical protein